MTNTTALSVADINQLFAQYGTALLTNEALHQKLTGASDTDLATAIGQYSTKALSGLKFTDWMNIYVWRPGLMTVLVPALDAAHIIAMEGVFVADAYDIAPQLTTAQLSAVLAKTGVRYLTSININYLSYINTSNLVAALLTRPTSELRTITDTEWAYLENYQTNLKALISDPSAELQKEIATLPSDFQTRFNTLIGNAGLKAYANPLLNASGLINNAYSGTTLQNGAAFITLFDNYYKNYIAKNPQAYGALITFYTQVATRSAFATNNVKNSVLPTEINQYLGWLGSVRDTVQNTKSMPVSDLMFSIYTTKIKATLGSAIGSFKSYSDLLTDVRTQINLISNTVIDPVTRLKYDPRAVEYLLDRTTSDGSANLIYNGYYGYTFKQAIQTAEKDLLSEADQYVKNVRDSISAYAKGKNFADIKDKLSDFFDVTGKFVSLISGLGRTNLSIQNNSPVNSVIGNAANIATETDTVSTLVNQEKNDWLSPTHSANSENNYYVKLTNAISDYTTILKRYGVITALSQEVNTFLTDLKTTLTGITDNLNKGNDYLGSAYIFNLYDRGTYEHDGFGMFSLWHKNFSGKDTPYWLNNVHHVSAYGPNIGSNPNGWDAIERWTENGPALAGYSNTVLKFENGVDLHDKWSVYAYMKVELYGYNPV